MGENKTVLSLLAHPDDCEFMCAGTLALLRQKGWDIHIATMTPGDCGSAEYNREQISKIRRGEAADGARLLEGTYHCLECEDVFIMYDRQTVLKAIRLMREVKPAIVFAPSCDDYFVDHEMTSKVAWTATFACGMMNVETEGANPFEPVPALYYVDAMDGKDKLGNEISPKIYTDISTVIDIKEKMLCCHASQRNWLLAHHGIDEYTRSMRSFAKKRGNEIGVDFAEGFRQHLGHSYPQENVLKNAIDEYLIEK